MGNCLSARTKRSHLEVAELRSAEVASLLATQERDLAGVKKELELSNAERDLAVIDASAHRERIQQLEAQYSISEQEWQKQIFELQSDLEQRETALSEQRRLPESRTKQGGALREELEQMEDGKKKVEEELQELQESKETLVQQHEVRRSRMKELYQSKMKESSDKVRQLEADITSLKYSNNELATAKILMGVKLSKAKRNVQELSKGITDAGPDSSEASAESAKNEAKIEILASLGSTLDSVSIQGLLHQQPQLKPPHTNCPGLCCLSQRTFEPWVYSDAMELTLRQGVRVPVGDAVELARVLPDVVRAAAAYEQRVRPYHPGLLMTRY